MYMWDMYVYIRPMIFPCYAMEKLHVWHNIYASQMYEYLCLAHVRVVLHECPTHKAPEGSDLHEVLQCVAVCCSLLQCVAVCCSALQRVAARCSALQRVAVCRSVLQCVAVCCRALQCVAARCSVLQCVVVCCSVLQLQVTSGTWEFISARAGGWAPGVG